MRDEGVFDLPNKYRSQLVDLITFHGKRLPEARDILRRAKTLADMADRVGAPNALVDGPGFLLVRLEHELVERGIMPYYAWGFVQRYNVETGAEGIERAKCRFVLSDLFPSPHHENGPSSGKNTGDSL